MGETLRIGLIGCGGMMGAHVKNGYAALSAAGYKAFEIVACCDVFSENAGKMAGAIAEWQGRKPQVYSQVDQLLSEERGLDAVDIVVTHSDHHRVAVPCIEAGKHVIIEKPLALTLRAGRKILDAAQARRVVLAVAENYRRSPVHRTVNWALQSGRVGRLRQLYWVDCRERLWYWGWRDEVDKAGGGWSLDGGVHFTDLMRYHLGPAARVTALSRQYNTLRYRNHEKKEGEIQATIEDTTMALIEFESGVTGVWVESIATPGKPLGTHIVYGDLGSLDFNDGLKLRDQAEATTVDALKEEFFRQLGEEEKRRLFPWGLQDGVAQEIHEFIEACLHGGSVETDGLEGYKAQAMCMAVYESQALGGQPVDMRRIEGLEIEAYQAALNRSVGL